MTQDIFQQEEEKEKNKHRERKEEKDSLLPTFPELLTEWRKEPKWDTIRACFLELIEKENWVCWIAKPRPNREGEIDITKPPISPHTGRLCDTASTEKEKLAKARTNWGTFDEVKRFWETHISITIEGKQYPICGIGLVLTPDLGIVGTDLDKVVKEALILPQAQEIIQVLNSYSEKSPSEKGVHIFNGGNKPGQECKQAYETWAIEMYTYARFLTVTGEKLEGTPDKIESRQAEIDFIYNKYIANHLQESLLDSLSKTEPAQKPQEDIPKTQSTPPYSPPLKNNTDFLEEIQPSQKNEENCSEPRTSRLTDEQIIEKARNARNGKKFQRLWEGDISGYNGDDSKADQALCAILAFWTQDFSQIDRLLRQSQLYRQKWDEKRGEKTYGQITIEKALKRVTRTYSKEQREINTGREGGGREHFTDLGNAKRLINAFGSVIKYCYEWESWLIWDSKRWLLDKTGEIAHFAKKTVQGIYGEAEKVTNDDLRKEIAKHAVKSESRMRIEAMISLARSERGIPITTAQMDADQWKLNVLNGTLDLKTGKLLPHQKEDLITKLSPIVYDPYAPYEPWLGFLNKIQRGNQNMISFLKRAVGYSFTGDVSEQVLFFLYGTGGNGKSKFLEAILGIMGQYAIQAAPDILMMKQYESHPTGLADLFGRRFVATIETEEGKRMAESLVKQMTGGDRMKARFMRQDFFEFQPTFKIWLAANHKPVIRGTDYAIWRRIRLIPFEVKIPEAERDKNIGEKLKAVYPGILRWAVEGCLEWQREGLNEPPEVIAATKSYQEEMDVFGRFLAEETVELLEAKVQANALYNRYVEWCKENGENPMTGTTFGKRMRELGHEKEHQRTGTFYKGLGLINNPEERVPF